jgi:hypothetical protein
VPSGGPREGTPGKAYMNRTDLNAPKSLPVQAVPSQQYGQRAAQEAAQQAVPMGPAPGTLTPLNAETQRPNEPIMAGAAENMDGDLLSDLQALYKRYPTRNLLRLILEAQS